MTKIPNERGRVRQLVAPMAEPCFLCIDKLADTRTGEDHFGVGLGDVGGFTVTLDGKDVGSHTLEALAGEEGWVVLMVALDGPGKILCSAGTPGRLLHPYAVLRRGRVVVAAPPRPLPRPDHFGPMEAA